MFSNNEAEENLARKFQFHLDLYPIAVLGTSPSSTFSNSLNNDHIKVTEDFDIPELMKVFL